MSSEIAPWRDKETLERLYWDERMTMTEIADKLGCGSTTAGKWLHRFDIEVRTEARIEAAREVNTQRHATYYHVPHGYTCWQCQNPEGGSDYLYVHRLLAVAEFGFDAVCGKEVHHKNEVPWDNRPENLEVLDKGEHKSHHVRKQPRNEQGELQSHSR